MRFPGKWVQAVTVNELKRAFLDERPVTYNGITYQKITAVIYRKTPDGKGLHVQGELLDRNGRAVVIAAADRITLPKGAGEDGPGRTERTG